MRIDVAKIQKRIVRRDDRSLGIINYDMDNAYPQRVVDIVNGSGVAKTCVDIFFKFINGSGFVDAALGSRIVDGEKTPRTLHGLEVSRFTSITTLTAIKPQ